MTTTLPNEMNYMGRSRSREIKWHNPATSSYRATYKPPVIEKYVYKFNEKLENAHQIQPIGNLEYPCNDCSLFVTNFSSWSYFKDSGREKIVGKTSCHIWNKELLERTKNRIKTNNRVMNRLNNNPKLSPFKTTRGQRMRMKSIELRFRDDDSSHAFGEYGYSTSLCSSKAKTKELKHGRVLSDLSTIESVKIK